MTSRTCCDEKGGFPEIDLEPELASARGPLKSSPFCLRFARQDADHGVERKHVRIDTEARNDALGLARHDGTYAAPVHVGHVDLDVRQTAHGLQAVAQRVASVAEPGRVHEETVDAPAGRLVDQVDRLALDVRVADLEVDPAL